MSVCSLVKWKKYLIRGTNLLIDCIFSRIMIQWSGKLWLLQNWFTNMFKENMNIDHG